MLKVTLFNSIMGNFLQWRMLLIWVFYFPSSLNQGKFKGSILLSDYAFDEYMSSFHFFFYTGQICLLMWRSK